MNKKYIKIGVISVVSLVALYGGYRLIKKIISNRGTEDFTLPVDLVLGGVEPENQTASKPSFNPNKVISKGSKGDEAKTIQQALNNIINDAKKVKSGVKNTINPTQGLIYVDAFGYMPVDSSSSDAKESRRLAVANIKPLTLDGIFGSKSVNALYIIMGKDSATYNEVKDKRINFSKAYGLGNPY